MPMSTSSRILAQPVETRDFKVDDQIPFDLPLGYDLDSVIVKLSGTITVGTAPTAYHEFAVPRLIDRIDLYANGKNKFAEVTGLKACVGDFEGGLSRRLTDIGSGTGAKTVEAYFRIDLATRDGVRPKDSNLHTQKPFMSKLQLKIATNNFNDMCKTLGSFAVSSNTLKIEVLVEQTHEFNDAAYFENRLVKVQTLIQETIDATKSQHKVKLSTGELMTRGVIVYALDENGALSNTVINSIMLKSGIDVPYNKGFADIREKNVRDYRVLGTQLPDGFAYLDLCPGGKLNTLWDTRGRSELELVMDVTRPAGGDASVIVVPVQYWEQDNSSILASLGGGQ